MYNFVLFFVKFGNDVGILCFRLLRVVWMFVVFIVILDRKFLCWVLLVRKFSKFSFRWFMNLLIWKMICLLKLLICVDIRIVKGNGCFILLVEVVIKLI